MEHSPEINPYQDVLENYAKAKEQKEKAKLEKMHPWLRTLRKLPIKTKEAIAAALTDSGLGKLLYGFLVAGAVSGAAAGIGKITLEKTRKEARGKIQITLDPPTNNNPEPITETPQDIPEQHQTDISPEPTSSEKDHPETATELNNSLRSFMSRLETAYNNEDSIYQLLIEAKQTLAPDDMKALIEKIVEITDENYPLPIEGMSEEEIDRYYENEMEKELNRRRFATEQIAESMATALIMEDPILRGFLLDAFEKKEREEKIRTNTSHRIDHRLRGAMIRILSMRLERDTSDVRPLRPHPPDTIDNRRTDLEILKKLGVDPEKIDRYERRLRNVS